MVTTTTKTLNYSIIRGNHTNSVNATITSTPGFNVNYFGKIPGILKLVELVLLIVSIGLAASRRREGRQYAPDRAMFTASVENWLAEYFLTGEVFYLCVQTAGLVWVTAVLLTYAMHIVSSVIVPKTTIHEVVFNFIFILMFWTAGIVELAETIPNAWAFPPNRVDMAQGDWGCRVAAGALSLFTGTFFLISFALAVKELQGPKRSAPISASPISTR
ncbi:uncharacterized protein LOC129584853 isoform X1 [Paramacrobiotus metropolitanus]|uniref:uncharacterized protein LOC129584853 isoform X1 n=1 Tax=Paramacrobiotus metropolitanus TaxID=2943436 RepID=UPI002445CD17|nr:uncharacterized protein LOC129584853 isoform X1 [Paramacrobiotus metropolitanus]XP_055333316.1 uncharacterized protein LOC129584853 isoform X1 [Paramacrobiotus metropolitanus]